MKITFANHIDTDILTALEAEEFIPVINNWVKCSKSVVPNALANVAEGELVEFCLGTIGSPCSNLIAHCWVEIDGQVLQTRVSAPNVKLYKNFSITLTPGDVEKAKEEIKSFIHSLI